MNAIILAAGLGSRLGSLTAARPKCLLELHGRTLLRIQHQLLSACGVSNITVVTGHGAASIERELGNSANYLYYPEFATSNNLLTLRHAIGLLEGDVVILFSDVLIGVAALRRCLLSPHAACLMIDTSECRPDTMRVQIDGRRLLGVGSDIPPETSQGNFIGIAKFSATATPELRRQISRVADQPAYRDAYYTAVLPALSEAGYAVGFVDIAGFPWIEIDSPADYQRALQSDFYRLGESTLCAASSES